MQLKLGEEVKKTGQSLEGPLFWLKIHWLYLLCLKIAFVIFVVVVFLGKLLFC